jgi:tricarballylate dehydrogenase
LTPTDVLVIGGGNAGLCAAITAREAGRSVLLVEGAPQWRRGGNSRHTRDIRCMSSAPDRFQPGVYTEDEFWDDLRRVTGGQTDEKLARLVIRRSVEFAEWMHAHGVQWQPPLHGTLHLARTNRFFLGGGKALVNAYYATAERLGVEIAYDAEVDDLRFNDGACTGAVLRDGRQVDTKAVVAAAGGFEANVEWLKRYWGDAADNFIIRGTPHNRGRVLEILLEVGAQQIGNEREFHAVAVDGRAPKFDGGIVTRLDSVPFGIVVNRCGERFYDEGEDFWPKRYAIWGGLIARQPDQVAYSIVDSKAMGKFMPSVFPPVQADSISSLSEQLDLDPPTVTRTVEEFNASVQPGTFDPGALDDCATLEGFQPPKSHWALPIDAPPYYAYPLRPGITFTYMGVGVDEQAHVIAHDERPMPNVFAAGEVMAGNILGRGYLAGFGLTIGTVFGRIAGAGAADAVR